VTRARIEHVHAPLKVKRLGLLTQDEAVVLMRSDCHVCRSEGLAARARVLLWNGRAEVIATLYHVEDDWLAADEVGVSEIVWRRLQLNPGDMVRADHAPALESYGEVRRRMYGGRLGEQSFQAIIDDIVAGRYADIHLASFITACSAFPLDVDEMKHLTGAMVRSGEQLSWLSPLVMDKHCVGGLPGNRTTPIVVAIAASLGLIMPKTSSRAITSPSGTADTMETLAPVALDIAQIRRVVEQQGACIAWGGAVRLSPADEIMIRIERALDSDTEGQLVASILSKKIAAGATHVVLDLPVGPTAKVRTAEAARSLATHLGAVADAFGLATRFVVSEGFEPVGRGIGPALEARDVLAVLQNTADAPADLRERALSLAGATLELAGRAAEGAGVRMATEALVDARAWKKFQNICEAQGGMRRPPKAAQTYECTAAQEGRLIAIDNRKLSRLAKLAGAPDDKAAGLDMHVKLGAQVAPGEPLFTIHAETLGELDYALEYAHANADIIEIAP